MKKLKVEFDKELENILNKGTLLTFDNGCRYTGMTKNDPKDNKKLIPHGLGYAMWPDKQSYSGQYKNGTFDGWGHYKTPGSHELIGTWKAGFLSKGEMKNVDGTHYVGDFKKSEFDGTGTMNYSGNYKYEGQWKDNNQHGKGKITFLKFFEEHEKGTVYKGTYKNGKMHGKFEIAFPDRGGDIIEAVFENGVRTKAEYKGERKTLLINIEHSDASFLEDASEDLKKDRKFILKAVKLNGLALEFADDSLRKDKEVVLTAMKENPRAMMDADDSLMTDKEIVLMGFNYDVELLDFAADSLKKDKEFILKLVKIDGYALEFADDSLKKDKEVVLEAIKASSVNTRVSEIIDKSLMEDSDVLAMIALIGKKK